MAAHPANGNEYTKMRQGESSPEVEWGERQDLASWLAGSGTPWGQRCAYRRHGWLAAGRHRPAPRREAASLSPVPVGAPGGVSGLTGARSVGRTAGGAALTAALA